MEIKKYVVIRDSREKANFWDFPPSKYCAETVVDGLPTGDYSLRGIETKFTIERKANTGEIAGNLYEKRFENELKRMQKFKHAFIVCEFLLEDLFKFPYGSNIPKSKWKYLKVNSNGLLKRIFELEVKYKCKFIFAGSRGKEVARILFARMAELYKNDLI